VRLEEDSEVELECLSLRFETSSSIAPRTVFAIQFLNVPPPLHYFTHVMVCVEIVYPLLS
jgi:hypothetical protein